MSKIAVVYWSGTGNTESMASAVVEGARKAGAEATLIAASEFGASMMDEYDAIAFGCPSMGTEQLEESEFEPMFTGCETKLRGKRIALFGSYGWGDGEWIGKTLAARMEPFSLAIVSFARRHQMMMRSMLVRSLAPHWFDRGFFFIRLSMALTSLGMKALR